MSSVHPHPQIKPPSQFDQRTLSLQQLGEIAFARPNTLQLILEVKKRGLSYLSRGDLADLSSTVLQLEKKSISGIFLEAGVALGGSALVIASTKNAHRKLRLYDTFEMIPPPTQADGEDAHHRYQDIAAGKAAGLGSDQYYGYDQHLLERVCDTFAGFNLPIEENKVELYKGLFEETLQVNEAVSLAHIDCDWYDSVMTCLERITPRLSVGGQLVINDYFDWSGAQKAVDEYFADQPDQFRFIPRKRLHIVRTAV